MAPQPDLPAGSVQALRLELQCIQYHSVAAMCHAGCVLFLYVNRGGEGARRSTESPLSVPPNRRRRVCLNREMRRRVTRPSCSIHCLCRANGDLGHK